MSIMRDDRPQLNNLREVSQQYIDAKNRGERGLVLPRESNLPVKKYAGVQTVESMDNICVFTKQVGSDIVDVREKPGKNESYPVPAKIAYDMVELIPDEVLLRPNLRVLDLSCNSGDCLQHIIYRLVDLYMNKYKKEYHFVSGTLKHMLKYTFDNVIYAICPSEKALEYTKIGLTRRLAETGVDESIALRNVYSWHELATIIHESESEWRYSKSDWSDIIKDEGSRDLVIKEIFGDMKFDVVIGNPPYNSDLYIDFVQKGFELLKPDGVEIMITPAKWQAKGGKKNDAFREQIVPHIKEIFYFRDALEVFPGTAMHDDAVVYYSIYKDSAFNDKIINGRLEHNWKVQYGFEKMYIELCERIFSRGERSIIDCGDMTKTPVKSYFTSANFGDVSEDLTSRYYMRSSARCIKVPERVFKNTNGMDKYKVYIGHYITSKQAFHVVEPFVADVREDLLLGFGSKEYCESIVSYYSCKLIWYMVYMTNCGNASREAFVNVPDPGAFDHIFTDEELYKKYDLTQEEINIIESVIKERK